MGGMRDWIVYHDGTTDKVGAVEDDHLGIAEMVTGRSDYRLLGYVTAKAVKEAINYGEQVFMNQTPRKVKRG